MFNYFESQRIAFAALFAVMVQFVLVLAAMA